MDESKNPQEDLETKNSDELNEDKFETEKLIGSEDPELIMEGLRKIIDSDHNEKDAYIQDGIKGLINFGNEKIIIQGLKEFPGSWDKENKNKAIDVLLDSDDIEAVKEGAKMLELKRRVEVNSLKTELHTANQENKSLKNDMEEIKNIREKM